MAPFLIGKKKARCPQCGGTMFMSVPVGEIDYLPKGGMINMKFNAKQSTFLCATVACGGRPWTMQDLQNQEEGHAAAKDGEGAGSQDRGAGGEARGNGQGEGRFALEE